MKTSKLKPRRMWAIGSQRYGLVILKPWERRLVKRSKHDTIPDYVRVAVIPLDDVDALIQKARDAYCAAGVDFTDNKMRAALTAIGVLPKKGRK